MSYSKDQTAGMILRANIISHGLFILVTAVLFVKVIRETPSRYLVAALLGVCTVYMILRTLRFFHLYRLWKGARFEMENGRARGYAADEKLRKGRDFDIPADSIEKAEMIHVPMTQKTPLTALKLTTDSETLILLGLVSDEPSEKWD